MNSIWSDHVQGILTLYLSRKLRFDDLFFDQYDKLFHLDKERPYKILEIGCGPGALAEALRRWYPKAEIMGFDRDSNFIAYARQHVPGVTFLEGDAAALPFPDNTFDVTISNTVQEHMEPSAFWGEQKRVLKKGGVCLCLSARRGIRCLAPCLADTEAETAFWAQQPDGAEEFEKYQVCRFPMTEAEIPAAMASYGFGQVSPGYAVIDLTPDDPKYPPQIAEAMIEAERQGSLEALHSASCGDPSQAIRAVNEKYGERLRLYRSGIRQWDTAVSVTMVIRGKK